jgi:hypothetical protein
MTEFRMSVAASVVSAASAPQEGGSVFWRYSQSQWNAGYV